MTESGILLVQPCNGCQAGQMHLNYRTYFTWLADELITVPNFPTWICDVCGRREYDPRAVNQLNLLLNPSAGRPTRQKPNLRQRSANPKNTWPTAD
jgi:YgiT-type zinc finger domain-containing protein